MNLLETRRIRLRRITWAECQALPPGTTVAVSAKRRPRTLTMVPKESLTPGLTMFVILPPTAPHTGPEVQGDEVTDDELIELRSRPY